MELVAFRRYITFLNVASNSVLRHHPSSTAVHQFDLLLLCLESLSILHECNRDAGYPDTVILKLVQLLLELCCFLDRMILRSGV